MTKILSKLTVALFVFGWFFAMKSAEGTPGVFVSALVGPYATEQICEGQREETEAVLSQLIADLEVKKCFKMDDA